MRAGLPIIHNNHDIQTKESIMSIIVQIATQRTYNWSSPTELRNRSSVSKSNEKLNNHKTHIVQTAACLIMQRIRILVQL